VNPTIGGVTAPVGTMLHTPCGILGTSLTRFSVGGCR